MYAGEMHRDHWWRLNFAGMVIGGVLYCFALTPSLLPRPPLLAGFVAGLSFAFGYACGAGLSWLVRLVVRRELPVRAKRAAWMVAFVALAGFAIGYTIWNTTWENKVRQLVGERGVQSQAHFLIILGTAALTTLVLLAVGRVLRWGVLWVSAKTARWVPVWASVVVGIAAVAAVVLLLYTGVLSKAFVRTSKHIYSHKNDTTAPGIKPPLSSLRSGGPGSLVAWRTLGYQGRNFIGSGPTQKQLSSFNGRPAAAPIRVYAGVESAPTIQARAALAEKELERTGAFNRPVLVVATVTGTGWVEPHAADALEYEWNGDTAIAAIQYSYLPSWISYLVDRQNAANAGRALFNAVYAKWQTLPAAHRPRLIAFGLSLGSYGTQSAFQNVGDVLRRTDGALFMGTPNFTPVWSGVEKARDPGSPEWQPVYDKDKDVAFAAANSDFAHIAASGKHPHVLYMQHASDPIVWWSYSLLWHEPDWLKEPRGPDVSPNTRWYPFVTFAQLVVDQLFATSVPVGHGHNYANTVAAAWAAVTSPPGWQQDQTARLQKVIDAYPN